jgi:hypothetical protein
MDTLGTNGATAPGRAAPVNEKALAAGTAQGFEEGIIESEVIVGTADDDRKRFATLQARAAIAGHELKREPVADGAWLYVMRRWGLRRELASLGDVAAWLDRATGVRHA